MFGHLCQLLVLKGVSAPSREGFALPPAPWGLLSLLTAAGETFCEMVQCYLQRLEDSVHLVMTVGQFAMKLFPVYCYFVTVWLRRGYRR